MGLPVGTESSAGTVRRSPPGGTLFLPLIVLSAGIALSCAGAAWLRTGIEAEARAKFERQAIEAKRAITARIRSYTDVLHAAAALFHISPAVSRGDFHRFVSQLDLTRYPALQIINFGRYVSEAERAGVEARVRGDRSLSPSGNPGFAIRPAGPRAAYYPLLFVEPMQGNEASFGLDIIAPPFRADAIERGRDSGELVSSGRIIRILEGSDRIAVAMRLAVYRAGSRVATVEERRAAYLGSIGAGFLIYEMMNGVLKEGSLQHLRFRLFDAGAVGGAASPERKLLFDSDAAHEGDLVGPEETFFQAKQRLPMGGRVWELEFSAEERSMIAGSNRDLPRVVLVGGILTSLLVAGLFYFLSSSRRRAVVLAERMTRDLRERESTLRYIAAHDALTELPNRTDFTDRLRHALKLAARHQHRVCVLFIDIDRFKRLNDTLGHTAGDALLRETARRIAEAVRESDTVARLGGDEFVVMLERLARPQEAMEVAQKILKRLQTPFMIDAHELIPSASIGVSSYPDDGRDAETLLKHADIAMYRAKDQGRGGCQYFSVAMNAHTVKRLEMEAQLRRALDRGEFVLHYQPKIDLHTGATTGVEALVRWQRPDTGMVSPADFIPVAEETGLIVPIGEWVLRTACAQAKAWQAMGLAPVRVAVNLSARQFTHRTLVSDIERVLREFGPPGNALELEITESLVMHDPEQAAATLRELRRMGVRISIDDFGTGYSSLAYIKRFPIDCIKIDRSFVKDIPGDQDDLAITEAVVRMAHALRLRAVAEGVETAEQVQCLREFRCDEAQGYFFSKPLPAREVTRLLADTHHKPRLTVVEPRKLA